MTDLSRRGLPRLATAPGLDDARFSDARGLKARGFEASGPNGPGDNARAGTSLTPYGMSFWALILAACGGGGGGGGGPETAGTPPAAAPAAPLPEPRQGYVYDGPVKGAGVYVDVDGDGELTDRDYFVGTTDGRGAFSGSVPASLVGRRYIVDLNSATDLGDDGIEGGTGVNADRTLQGTWLAPEGSSVVSALTHLIATGVRTLQEVESAFPNFNPLVDDPYGVPLTEEKREAFLKVRKALPAITRIVQENRDLIDDNARKIQGLENKVENLEEKLKDIQQKLDGSINGSDPALTKSGALRPLSETTSSTAAYTGLRFAVTDPDDNFADAPVVSDGRFELRPSGGAWQLWVKQGQTFRPNETIILTITATDDTSRRDYEVLTLTVKDVEHPPELTITRPGRQTPVNETVGDGVTSRIDTGIGVTAGDPDGNLQLPLKIERQKRDGSWQADNRFEVSGGKLLVRAGQKFDFEDADNPGGVIKLQITATDTAGNEVQKPVTIQLTDANDPTTFNSLVIKEMVNRSAPLGKTLKAEYSASDEDGIALREITWTHNNTAVTNAGGQSVISDSIIPGLNRTGEWRAILTVTDRLGNIQSLTSDPIIVTAPVADPPRPNPDSNPDAGPGAGPAVPDFVVSGGSDRATGQLVENVGAATRQGEIDTGYAIGIAKRLLSKTYQADEVLDSTVVKFATGRSNNDTRFILKSAEDHSGISDHHYFQLYIKRGATFNFEEDVREGDAGNSVGKIAVAITFTDKNKKPHKLDADPNTGGVQPFLVALRNVDEKPTKMELSRSSHSLNEGDVTAPDGIKLATVNFEDSDRKTEFRNNEVEIRSIDGVDLLDPDDHALFVIRNGNELWVKTGVTLNYERTAQFSNRLTGVNFGDHLSAYKIVLRHKTDGTRLDPLTFTLNINNQPEKPVVEVRDAATARPLPSGRLTEKHDTGITVKIYDPDSINSDSIQKVTPTVSDSDRFTLEEYQPILNIRGMPLQPQEPGVKYYRLVAKAGAQFAANESISLTISGTDDSAGNLTTTSPSFQLNVAAAPAPGLPAARVPTTPETPDTHDGQTGAPDIREVDTTPGNAASADRINNLESDDKIRVDLEYVLLKVRVRTIDDRPQTVVDIFSPHDLTLEDNYLATVFNPSYDVTNGIGAPRGTTYFTTRAGDGTTVTKAYHLVEANERNAPLSNNYNRNDAFVIDTTPSDESDAVKITNFRPGEGDALVFTGNDIYWQVKYDAGGFGQTPSYKLVFYSTGTVQTNNVLAVLDGYIHEGDDGLVFVAPTADLFLGNKPNLHVIPIERKHYDTSKFVSIFSQSTGRDEPHYILQPLEGVNFVTDYFNPLYSRFISGVQIRNNEPARITNFEDGRDKILLDVGEINKYWWKEISEERPSAQVGAPPDTIKVIELYNTATPAAGRNDQIIARIMDFDGTFSHDDFIHADGTAVNSGQIIEIL